MKKIAFRILQMILATLVAGLAITVIKDLLTYQARYSAEEQADRQAQEVYWNAQSAEIQKHEKEWADQGIHKYRIGMRLSYDSRCSKELVIEDNKVAQVIGDGCKNESFDDGLNTVDDLFSSIAWNIDHRHCGPNGCDCDGPALLDATYDEKYKYPRAVRLISNTEKSGMFRNKVGDEGTPFISPLLRGIFGKYIDRKFCTLLGELSIVWEIDSFSPTP